MYRLPGSLFRARIPRSGRLACMPAGAGEYLDQMNASQHMGMVSRLMQSQTPNIGGFSTDIAGSMMSRGMGMGMPLMTGAASMMGLDPLSLGFKAASSVWGMGGGVLSAGMAGMGALGAAGAIGMGVQYAGGQMMHGAQQQMALNNSLSHMPFRNNQGGMGFTAQQGFDIGNSLHGMTGANGPGGEVTTFGELSRLASNMGRMGMSQNTRTVSEFKEKFKQLIDTTKQVATDLGTTLEEGMKALQSMKSSGVFAKGDALKMSGGMRAGAMAGSLAMSEMSGAASIGSQISRAIGGLGKQGAMAGINTMTQIGLAQQTGAISEEDIYNATGLNGAEGRQALAASQMQQSASFLRGGRGRRFLASIAGKNGELDEDSVNQWMAGGIGTGETMQMAGKNLGKVGRANFIRNEGRLRGAALEKFGGLAQSMVYKNWLSDRGYDPNEMDDRSMIAFERFSGLGREESEVALKQLNAMPEMVKEMRNTQRDMAYGDSLARHKNNSGISGLKRKFDAKREEVQGKLQEVGAKILESGQDSIESWFNHTMGIYHSMATEGIGEIGRSLETAGGSGAQYNRFFGKGGPGGGGPASEARKASLAMQVAARAGISVEGLSDFSKKNSDFIKEVSLAGNGSTPEELTNKFKTRLWNESNNGNTGAADMLAKMRGLSAPQQAAMVQTMQMSAGYEGNNMLDILNKEKEGYSSNGEFATQAEFRANLGHKLMGGGEEADMHKEYENSSTAVKVGGNILAAHTRFIENAIGGIGKMIGSDSMIERGKATDNMDFKTLFTVGLNRTLGGGHEDYYKGAASLFEDKETLGMMADLDAGGDLGKTASSNILNKIGKMRKGKMGELEQGQVAGLSAAYLGASADVSIKNWTTNKKVDRNLTNKYREISGEDHLSDEEIMDRISNMKGGSAAAMHEVNLENLRVDRERIQSGQAEDIKKLSMSGFITGVEGGKVILSARAQESRKNMTPEERAAAEMADSLLTFDANADHKGYYDASAESKMKIGSLSIASKKKLVAAGGAAASEAGYQILSEQRFTSGAKGGKGDLGGLAAALGLKVDDADLKGLKGSNKEKIAQLLGSKGVVDEDLTNALSGVLNDSKNAGAKAAGIDKAMAGASESTRKKLEEARKGTEDPNVKGLKSIETAIKESTTTIAGAIDGLAASMPGNPEGGTTVPIGKQVKRDTANPANRR